MMMSPADATDGQYGLGFYLTNWQGEIIPNHTGSTPGFRSYFQVLPNQRHAIVVLTNSSNGEVFNNRVVGHWLQWLKSLGEIKGTSAEQLELDRQANITELIQLINEERARNDLSPLLTSEYIMRDAQSNSQMMAAVDDVEGHDLGGFADRMTSLNYGFDYFYYWAAYGSQLNAQGAYNIWRDDSDTFA
ncbi:MAG TPA: serine hydrolase, partial [Aggregatilineales bacterium]|nr:serine hydrolase [Aggregatilineales bacterium]